MSKEISDAQITNALVNEFDGMGRLLLVQEILTVQAERDKLKKDRDYDNEHYIFKERPEFPCKKCGGRGERAYGTTATWTGSAGGNMITGGVCDRCWGTGDAKNKGPNLRVLYMELKEIKWLKAERDKLQKQADSLKDAVKEALSDARSRWEEEAGSHPVSRFKKDVDYYQRVLDSLKD